MGEQIMKVELSVLDRLTLVYILPTTGSIQELVEVMDIIRLIKLTEQEKKTINYQENNGKVTWNPESDLHKEVDFSFEQIKVIKDTIDKLDVDGKVSLSILDTCLKFSKL